MDSFSVLLSILVLVCYVSAVIIEKNPTVKLDLGRLQGNYMTTRKGLKHYAFRGIPYAEPPVGQLRFKPPKPFRRWSGVRNATKDGSICPQLGSNPDFMSENCLFLNVYTRWLPTKHEIKDCSFSSKAKPVLVYIHGGAFVAGSSASEAGAGPYLLMDTDIVLVTLNYRLGALGFLSTGTHHSPGNYGMMDQMLAFKWIRDHIKHFGGNPNSVTMLGYSAGSICTTLHIVSPMSKGLFHKAIPMSGSGVGQFDLPYNQLHLAQRQARLFNCSIATIPAMMDCLRRVDAIVLARSLSNLIEFICPPLWYLPVIDGFFLKTQPKKSYLKGDFMKIPIMTGDTEYEWLFSAIVILSLPDALQRLNEDFRSVAPLCAWYEEGTKRSFRASDTFRSTMPDPIANDNTSITAFERIVSFGIIKFPQHRFVRLTCKHTKVYYYQSTFTSTFNYLGRSAHGFDLICLFAPLWLVPSAKQNDSHTQCIERYTQIWFRFARTGNPNLPNVEFWKNLKWKPTTVKKFEYLEIGDDLAMKENYDAERYELWEELFPITEKHCSMN